VTPKPNLSIQPCDFPRSFRPLWETKAAPLLGIVHEDTEDAQHIAYHFDVDGGPYFSVLLWYCGTEELAVARYRHVIPVGVITKVRRLVGTKLVSDPRFPDPPALNIGEQSLKFRSGVLFRRGHTVVKISQPGRGHDRALAVAKRLDEKLVELDPDKVVAELLAAIPEDEEVVQPQPPEDPPLVDTFDSLDSDELIAFIELHGQVDIPVETPRNMKQRERASQICADVAHAIITLRNRKESEAVPALIARAAKGNHSHVRNQAVIGLGMIGDERAVEPLAAILMEDTDPTDEDEEPFRRMVAESLKQLPANTKVLGRISKER
jgi:hypothetical protein